LHKEQVSVDSLHRVLMRSTVTNCVVSMGNSHLSIMEAGLKCESAKMTTSNMRNFGTPEDEDGTLQN